MAEIIAKSKFKGVLPKKNAGNYQKSISLNRVRDIRKNVKSNIMSHAKSEYYTTYYTKTEADRKIFQKIMNHDYRTGKL